MSDNYLNIYAALVGRDIPARLDVKKTAKLLGFAESDLTILMGSHQLIPLGKPAPNAPKYFAAIDIIGLATNSEWLDKATRLLSQHWKHKRQARQTAHSTPNPE